ncbi:MAG: hypothetical protein E4G89_07255 [Methanothrix sp.]|nr:MAG: hypothetical protein E4G89_07255 [Methanothrix sp.]
MEDIRWTWCNMAYFRFVKGVARECKGYITYQELFNWLVHAYDQSQLLEMISAIKIYRGLLSYQRNALNKDIEQKLKSLLDRYMSPAAFGHYRTKIRDLMEAFATTGDFYLKGEYDSARLVLTPQGRES